MKTTALDIMRYINACIIFNINAISLRHMTHYLKTGPMLHHRTKSSITFLFLASSLRLFSEL